MNRLSAALPALRVALEEREGCAAVSVAGLIFVFVLLWAIAVFVAVETMLYRASLRPNLRGGGGVPGQSPGRGGGGGGAPAGPPPRADVSQYWDALEDIGKAELALPATDARLRAAVEARAALAAAVLELPEAHAVIRAALPLVISKNKAPRPPGPPLATPPEPESHGRRRGPWLR